MRFSRPNASREEPLPVQNWRTRLSPEDMLQSASSHVAALRLPHRPWATRARMRSYRAGQSRLTEIVKLGLAGHKGVFWIAFHQVIHAGKSCGWRFSRVWAKAPQPRHADVRCGPRRLRWRLSGRRSRRKIPCADTRARPARFGRKAPLSRSRRSSRLRGAVQVLPRCRWRVCRRPVKKRAHTSYGRAGHSKAPLRRRRAPAVSTRRNTSRAGVLQ